MSVAINPFITWTKQLDFLYGIASIRETALDSLTFNFRLETTTALGLVMVGNGSVWFIVNPEIFNVTQSS